MRKYRPPEIVWQEIDLADILTESPPLFGTNGQDDLTVKWDAIAGKEKEK